MPVHKYTLEFESAVGVIPTSGSKSGWSESWYDVNNLAQTADAVERALLYVAARRKLLTPGWTVSAVRVTSLDANFIPTRKGALAFVQQSAGQGTYGAGVTGIDEQPYDALNFAIATNLGFRRAFLMRGIGNDWVNAGGRFVNPALFGPAYGNWQQFITGTEPNNFGSAPFGIRYRQNQGSDVPIAVFCGQNGGPSYASTIQPVVRVTLPTSIAGGTVVRLSRFTGIQGLNGVWNIAKTVDNAGPPMTRDFVLAPKRGVTLLYTPGTIGTVKAWTYAMDPIVLATPGYGASRRTGRPLQLVRGRRSNRAQ